ncbi:MAG: HAD-IC family P-type ATPase [candidate division SR1 bacterium]|nr:HAD-IC family P-type ATPase [candidate division SR1 bacterium]
MLYPGLNQKNIQESLQKFGSNVVRSKSDSSFTIFTRQLLNPLVYLLILSGIISFVLKDYLESLVIFIILFINTSIGFSQEYKSKKLLAKISSYISSKAEVVRDSKRQKINKSELVIGDIVLLKLGDVVPADCVLLKAEDIRVNESILTGESEIIYKSVLVLLAESNDSEHLLYSGSFISHGSGIARVIAIGNNTKFGTISHLALNTKKPSQFEKNSESLSKSFSLVGIVFLFIIVGLQLYIKPDAINHWAQLAIFTITLMVSLIPEELPIITSLTLAQKSYKLGKSGLIIRHLTALEDLGNIDILCTDKTGTLTMNKQKVINYTFEHDEAFSQIWLLSIESADDIDIAVHEWLDDNKKLKKPKLTIDDYTDIPFDPKVRLSGRILQGFTVYKGSTESILDLCSVTNKKRETILSEVHLKSRNGLRAISYASSNSVNGKKIYLGTVFLADEIKDDADDVVRACKKNGVTLKILTGDSLEVAIYVAQQAGLIENTSECVDVSTLPFDDEDLLEHIIKSKKVFARTRPEDKYKIIQILQKNHVVGYLGDGINDAPALALAQVGIVVDTASDIAKSTADIILLKPELSTIIYGIREGRAVFENIQKYLKFTLIGNFGNAFTIGLISLLLPYQPILAIQVLIVNLLTDLPMLSISGDSVELSELRSPKKQEIHKLLFFCIFLGLFSTIFDFVFIGLHQSLPPGQVQTSWFFFSVCTELLLIFSIRSRKNIFRSVKPKRILVGLALFTFTVTVWLTLFGFRYLEITVLSLKQIPSIIILALLYLLASEMAKLIFYKYIDLKIDYD